MAAAEINQTIVSGVLDGTQATVRTPKFLVILADGSLKVSSAGGGVTADQIQGNVAGAAADSGNPVKIGAVYNTTLPTYTNGQRTDVQADSRGRLIVVTTPDATGTQNVQGNVASAAADSGNPVKVGGVYTTADPTYTNGQRGDFRIDVNGNLKTNQGALSRTTDSISTQYTGTPTHTTGGFTTTSAQVLAANANRRYLLIQNVSDTDVWINLAGGTATAAAPSVKIVATTGALYFETNYVPTAAITGIHGGTGTKNVSIIEG